MSVSDPLLKELKGHAQHLVEIQGPIRDSDEFVFKFCECLERIFLQGISCINYSPISFRPAGIWDWFEVMADNRFGSSYNYQTAVDNVKECVKVKKNRGKARLLIRMCLVQKCLHVPVQNYLMHTSDMNMPRMFSPQSILGDDILSQILCSVLMWVGRLNFTLDLKNSRFLDETWELPITNKLELVPCEKLGVTVIFVEGKAVCFEVQKSSVAAEDDAIEVGDIIDELNGDVICTSSQGCLNSIMKKTAGFPISIYLIKARWKDNLFPPIVPLLIAAKLDLSSVRANLINKHDSQSFIKSGSGDECSRSISGSGAILYMGSVSTGRVGDVKQIATAINQILANQRKRKPTDNQLSANVQVSFECLDLGVKITDKLNSKVLLRHSYMEIASCGCAVDIPYYFAYIASDGLCSECDSFVCYVFHCNVQTEIDTILNSIGQGFKRTHYVV